MYGYDTHSWRNSTEKRQMDRERAEATRKFIPLFESVLQPLTCNCRSFQYPHGLEAHTKLRSDYDWRIGFRNS
jgi:hypothetical protein